MPETIGCRSATDAAAGPRRPIAPEIRWAWHAARSARPPAPAPQTIEPPVRHRTARNREPASPAGAVLAPPAARVESFLTNRLATSAPPPEIPGDRITVARQAAGL